MFLCDGVQKPAYLAEECCLACAAAQVRFGNARQAGSSLTEVVNLLKQFSPRPVWRGVGTVVALTGEDERSVLTGFPADVPGESRLSNAGLSAENDKPPVAALRGAKLCLDKSPL